MQGWHFDNLAYFLKMADINFWQTQLACLKARAILKENIN